MTSENKIYFYPVWLRIWHGLNAIGIIVLIITGISMQSIESSFIQFKTAVTLPKEDDQVDELFNDSYRSIVNAMIANPQTIDESSLLLWVVHNLERFADRVVNICERTVFIKSGEMMEMDTNDDELEEDS